jgi:hypothetical protein
MRDLSRLGEHNLRQRVTNAACVCVSVLLLWITGCGDPQVRVTNTSYEPRIVIAGLLMPDHPVNEIHISRNFRVNENPSQTPLLLPDAMAVLIEEETGERFELTFTPVESAFGAFFDFQKSFFAYQGEENLTIRHGADYTLEVSAEMEGQELFARATTTVPERGFRIAAVSHERFRYRERGTDDEVITPELTIERSPGTDFHLMTAVPLAPSPTSFIYDNPFTDEDPNNLDLGDFVYEFEWIQNTPLGSGLSSMQIFWWDLWFYGQHRIVVYAADANYASFLQTFDEVQEDDGNFHEPVFSIEGDGIGYFGSAIPDTVHVEILRD